MLQTRKLALLYQGPKSLFGRNSGARHENVQKRTVEHCAKEVLSDSADWKYPMLIHLKCLHVSMQTGDI